MNKNTVAGCLVEEKSSVAAAAPQLRLSRLIHLLLASRFSASSIPREEDGRAAEGAFVCGLMQWEISTSTVCQAAARFVLSCSEGFSIGGSMMMMQEDGLETHQVEIDPDFQPQSRPRSCTWPPPCSDDFPGQEQVNGVLPLTTIKVEPDDVPSCRAGKRGAAPCPAGAAVDAAVQLRKAKSSRRNAWGNQSYADLITRAIESTPEKRLTLSQIYDWMVRYVPYFKDKGDSNSSAGWKNSIRHNLSLHTRFIRVQNEGTGKSSWWMLNPEGSKAGKTPRRRAISMDNGTKYLKSKGRVSRKKIMERPGPVSGPGLGPVTRVGLHSSPERRSPNGKPVTGASVDEFDSWTDLHSRASSSGSTLSGCLSPILAEAELEEPEEGRLSCSTSPHLYPSPSNTVRSPSMAVSSLCPTVELPQLAELTGAISLDESLLDENFHQSNRHKHPGYNYNTGVKGQGSYCGQVFNQAAVVRLQHHSPMETIQENKTANFSESLQPYSVSNALQSLLTRGPQFCAKEMLIAQERKSHTMMVAPTNSSVGSGSHHRGPHSHNGTQRHNPTHNHNGAHNHNATFNHTSTHSHNGKHNHNPAHTQNGTQLGHNTATQHNPGSIPSASHSNHSPHNLTHNQSHRARSSSHQTYNHNAKVPYIYSPRAHAHLPASTTLPPNPANFQGIPPDSCNLATAPQPHSRHHSSPYNQGPMANGLYHHTQGMCGGNVAGLEGTFHGYQHPIQHPPHPHPHERFPADLDLDVFHGSLDCDVESILLHDIMDSTEEMDFNDCSLAQGVGIGMGMGMGVRMGGLSSPQQSHSNQSWVPG
ncbi:forkhead box protein O3-like [Denticeps clupeoides]|uniref:Fork-head domain-containing protein n=1 Tax=Denticeps clupeoides TaxID=299321 RepID=A0AAY4CUS3_9TELE|nr:forkhead box protein O3-like [Denticeps clupeoides]